MRSRRTILRQWPRLQLSLLFLVPVLVVNGIAASHSGDITYTLEGKLNSCEAGPKIRVLGVRRQGTEKDACSGSYRIQGVRWTCAESSKSQERVTEFRSALAADAELRCLKLCSERAPGCEGRFRASERCGLETNSADAARLGAKFGCKRDCTGPEFSYCSLYDEGYLGNDLKRSELQLPNCECVRAVR